MSEVSYILMTVNVAHTALCFETVIYYCIVLS